MQLLTVYGETVVTMSVRDSHYDSNFNISSENGLKFAVAIIEYDGNPEPIDDPRYGQIVAQTFSWGFADQQGVSVQKMGLHRCTEEELNLEPNREVQIDKNDTKFFPIHPNSEKDVKLYKKKLWCMDDDVVL